MRSSTEAGVTLREATVRIDGRQIIGPIDLDVGAGERWVVLGPNGCGKTTLLSLAGARMQPSSGWVRVLDTYLGHGDVRRLHGRIGHASHTLSEKFPRGMQVIDVVLTGKRSTLAPWMQTFSEADVRRATDRLLDVGCEDLATRRFDTGSQGERQRILIARAMYGEPQLLILDEPAAGLDLPAREALISALEKASAGPDAPTTLLATHHLEEIPPSTTHAALMRDGVLVASGAVAEVLIPECLRGCFGVDVEVGRRNGRWWAVAGK